MINCLCCKHWGKCTCHTTGDMSEIYCSGIDSSGSVDEGGGPPFIPTCGEYEETYITPAQYKERTGREYPDGGAVFERPKSSREWRTSVWRYSKYEQSQYESYGIAYYVLCAFGDRVPSDDRRPEEEDS